MKNTLKFIIAIAAPLAIGALGSYFTISEIKSWYQTINKPSFNPPSYVFGPVWTILYILIGISFFFIWQNNTATSKLKTTAIALFVTQLVLNFLWSVLFFNQHQIGWALVDIVLLWLSILLMILSFAKINILSAWLLVPYISWVSFATILNYNIWILNK
jgi:translocator protein